MKKTMVFLLTGLTVLSLAACGSKDAKTSETASQSAAATDAAATEAAATDAAATDAAATDAAATDAAAAANTTVPEQYTIFLPEKAEVLAVTDVPDTDGEVVIAQIEGGTKDETVSFLKDAISAAGITEIQVADDDATKTWVYIGKTSDDKMFNANVGEADGSVALTLSITSVPEQS